MEDGQFVTKIAAPEERQQHPSADNAFAQIKSGYTDKKLTSTLKLSKSRSVTSSPNLATGKSTEGNKRPRSPSGLSWDPKVQSIKNFLQTKHSFSNHGNEHAGEKSPAEGNQDTTFSQPCLNMVKPSSLKYHDNSLSKVLSVNKQSKQLSFGLKRSQNRPLNTSLDLSVREILSQLQDCDNLPPEEKQRTIGNSDKDQSMSVLNISGDSQEESQTEEMRKEVRSLLQQQGVEMTDDQLPKVVDMNLVVKMFTQINTKMTKMDQKLKNLTKENTAKEIEILTDAQLKMDQEVQKMQTQLHESKVRNTILTGTISRMNQVMSEMQSRVERIEANIARRIITISGFYASSKKDIRIKQLHDFFHEHMMIDVSIEDATLSGEAAPPQIIVTLSAADDKTKIYEAVHRVKDYVNKDGKKLYFMDFNPPAVQEIKKGKVKLSD